MIHCKDCKWRGGITRRCEKEVSFLCENPKMQVPNTGVTPLDGIDVISYEDLWHLLVGPEFGCVNGEAKESPQ